MDSKDDSRELLFGVTALRLGLVDRSALIGLLGDWTSGRGQPLSRLLTERGLLKADKLAALEAEVTASMRAHQGNARLALAEAGPIAEELTDLITNFASFDTLGAEPTLPVAPEPLADTSPGTGVVQSGSSSRGFANDRIRSTAPGAANWAAPRPSTKYPRRTRPASSKALSTV